MIHLGIQLYHVFVQFSLRTSITIVGGWHIHSIFLPFTWMLFCWFTLLWEAKQSYFNNMTLSSLITGISETLKVDRLLISMKELNHPVMIGQDYRIMCIIILMFTLLFCLNSSQLQSLKWEVTLGKFIMSNDVLPVHYSILFQKKNLTNSGHQAFCFNSIWHIASEPLTTLRGF